MASRVDPDFDSRMFVEGVRSLLAGTPRSIPFNTVLAIVVAVIIRESVPHTLLYIWLAAFVVIPAARLMHALYAKARLGPIRQVRNHFITYTVFTGMNGLLWGGGFILFEPYLPTTKVALVLIVMSGICSGGATSMPTSRAAFLAFMIPILVIPAGWLLAGGESDRIEFVVLIFIFIAGLASVYSATRKVTLKAIRLQLERTALTEQLEATNEGLVQARDALWGEMQLARKLQTKIVPQDPHIDGYDISVHMQPADEVGGDYYDVIHEGNRAWVVIGDVSGHGVSAGLVMMMAQTAIRTALAQNPSAKPADLLTTINRVIHHNIQRLDEEKYMTITVLAVGPDGTFQFAGLHQDILIYRAAQRRLETIEVEGMWLGIIDDIDTMNFNNQLQLADDDVMILFTDGLTEARDEAGQMYSLERLQSKLTGHCAGQTSAEIVYQVLGTLGSYEAEDDVTLFVMRRFSTATHA